MFFCKKINIILLTVVIIISTTSNILADGPEEDLYYNPKPLEKYIALLETVRTKSVFVKNGEKDTIYSNKDIRRIHTETIKDMGTKFARPESQRVIKSNEFQKLLKEINYDDNDYIADFKPFLKLEFCIQALETINNNHNRLMEDCISDTNNFIKTKLNNIIYQRNSAPTDDEIGAPTESDEIRDYVSIMFSYAAANLFLKHLDPFSHILEDNGAETSEQCRNCESIPDHHVITPNNIGYIALHDFSSEKIPALIREILGTNDFKSVSGLIIDLRGNPGGSVSASDCLSSLFLPPQSATSIEITKLEKEGKIKFKTKLFHSEADKDNLPNSLPIILLVNEETASASEQFISALRGNKRAIVVGTKTFGKTVGSSTFCCRLSTDKNASLNSPEMAEDNSDALNIELINGILCSPDPERPMLWGHGIDPDFIVPDKGNVSKKSLAEKTVDFHQCIGFTPPGKEPAFNIESDLGEAFPELKYLLQVHYATAWGYADEGFKKAAGFVEKCKLITKDDSKVKKLLDGVSTSEDPQLEFSLKLFGECNKKK